MTDKILNTMLNEANKAYLEDEIPVGAIIVKDNVIVAKAHNKKQKYNCCTKHAEIICIEKISRKINDWRLNDYDMYITMEPCLMCLGTIEQSRIKNIYYLVENSKYGCLGNKKINLGNINVNLNKINNNKYEKKCKDLLKEFFDNKR